MGDCDTMYLIVPEGVIKVIWDAYRHLKFTSRYWTIHPTNPKVHIFTFPWENAVYKIVLNEEKKQCVLSIDLDGVPRYAFKVHALLLDQDFDTKEITALSFSVTPQPPNPQTPGTFSIYPIPTTSPIHRAH